MKNAVLFGGGSIGRSFITPVLQKAGFRVSIVDLNSSLIKQLNRKKQYDIVIRKSGGDGVITITDFSAIDAADETALFSALKDADLLISSVGMRGMISVCRVLAKELMRREERGADAPMDLILAENIPAAAAICTGIFREELGEDFPLNSHLGLIETSIGKMVPLLTEKDRREDPLRLFAEEYNTLILDREGFINPPPVSADIQLVSPIQAYIDRKLFIHNMGHSAAAYLGRKKYPEITMIWEVLEHQSIFNQLRSAMMTSAHALSREYPSVFTIQDLEKHVDDLLFRFQNRSLGDTVERVGRDLKRKLSAKDRIAGSLRLAEKHKLDASVFYEIFEAALIFGKAPAAMDEDREIFRNYEMKGLKDMMDQLSFSGE
ncbi:MULTISPECIES: mannitol-1-phosphate 5-dehydrogenase [unclassified Oceanispirochaeta]|uniref:mannitol dehydrogenase family protein n=1 Tax=unclassified Oceanispirochaeta TaxID=2635722 RepID=UPI000E095D72|nr:MULTISPECIES: mannitol-1-phosphate 5-dehydrogenase [unclassified Oceanispirochaeta]MBF9017230.1 mannitol-1-phosphate 5-dehydrogenase [Oceanispirochaeta sp. M2]NPD73679.1 mannitol-1-phosphate 5-dehydrogenase [Oceanispirochaeta sp. M1]RDG30607.1 mannitol-1-phosphate 5-dehydrogenase [Oceanispirochaeta sp. M1]